MRDSETGLNNQGMSLSLLQSVGRFFARKARIIFLPQENLRVLIDERSFFSTKHVLRVHSWFFKREGSCKPPIYIFNVDRTISKVFAYSLFFTTFYPIAFGDNRVIIKSASIELNFTLHIKVCMAYNYTHGI
jgi:hypothetical protein